MIAFPPVAADLSAFLIRLVVGVSFVVASSNKSKDLRKFARNNGLPVPMAFVVMVAEMAGGLGMITGILAQLAAIGLMLLMLGTIRLHVFKWKSPYWAAKGGWEYDLMLFALASVIAIHGPGRFSI